MPEPETKPPGRKAPPKPPAPSTQAPAAEPKKPRQDAPTLEDDERIERFPER